MSDFDLSGGEGARRAAKVRQRIEAALTLARHKETAQAERDAAIAGALRMIEAAGLSPDSFDIPGRARSTTPPPPRSRYRDDLFARSRSPAWDWSSVSDVDLGELGDIFRRFTEHMARAERGERRGATDFGDDNASAFAYAAEAMRRRERAKAEEWTSGRAHGGDPNRSGPAMDRLRADLCVAWLWGRQPPVRVYGDTPAADGSRRWRIPERDERDYTDQGVIEVAQALGWGREEPPNPFATADRVYVGDVDVEELHCESRAESERDELAAAAGFLRGLGFEVERIPDSDFWSIDGEVMQSRRMLFSAKLRGFE